MGAYLSKPVTDKEFENGEDDFLSFVTCSMQGWRTSQEDSHNCIINFHDNMSLFAVYDGHGGAEVAQLCSDRLPDFIKLNSQFSGGNYSDALTESFLLFDESILTAEIQDVLKTLANIDDNKSNDEDDDDEEDDPNLLQEEATLPLAQLLKKYKMSMLENGSDEEETVNHEEELTEESTTSKDGIKKVNETSEDTAEDEEDEEFVVGDEEDEEDEEEDDEEDEDEEEGENEENEEDDCRIGVSKLQDMAYMHSAPGYDSGSTAVVALIDRASMTIYVANAGDSRAVLCRGGHALDLSVDHKPEDELESARITRAGGVLSEDGRVNGGLNLSRSLGDHSYKQNKTIELKDQMISALPDIKTVELRPLEDEFLVMACDGIWNTFSSVELIEFIKLRLPKMDLKQLISEIFSHCLAPNTSGDGTGCDNMTCIIVRFKAGQSSGAVCNGGGATIKRPVDSTDEHTDGAPPAAKVSKVQP